MDNFSVTVDQLPPGMSATELLEEIRLNINDFLGDNPTKFSPYDEYENYPYDEYANWTSNDPVGSIIHIYIPPDDGSVVVSKYSSSSWIFTTIRAPWDWDHPVSGNREFGFTTNSDGSYTFYTKGVDRFTQGLTGETMAWAFGLGNPFYGADELWSDFQAGIEKFVNSNGGSATIKDPEFLRPNWEKLRKYFDGEATSVELGCKN